MRQENNRLNVWKGIGCFSVVFIHAHFPGLAGDVIHRLAQFAVPVFFMTSGYYSNFRNDMDAALYRKVSHIFRIAIWPMVLFGLISFAYSLVADRESLGIGHAVWILVKFFVLNDVDFLRMGLPLWFLWALIYAYIILWWVAKKKLWKLAYCIAGMLFLLKLLIPADWNWHYQGNWLMSGVPYVFLGQFIAAYQEKFRMMDKKQILCMGGIGAAISLFSLYPVPYNLSEIGIVLLATAIFLHTLQDDGAVSWKWLAHVGKKHSLYVYIYHFAILFLLKKMTRIYGLSDSMIWQWILPVLVASAAYFTSEGIYFLKHRVALLQKRTD